MDIPDYLETVVREGKAILFLGAGASFEAKNSLGQKPPSGKKLGEMLADRFLGGRYKDYPLNQIGEFAISESDLTTVQEYIREIFEGFEPTDSHKLMTTFCWDCLATTNYDLIIEKAYRQMATAAQVAVPFIENGDRVEDKMRDPRSVMLLKLHGCITRTANATCPLILTTEQYIDYLSGRDRIFEHLRTKAFERHIIFVGYGLQDPNLRAILLQLASLGEKRPRYYLVSPTFDDIQQRFWEAKRISPLPGTFDDFINTLNVKLPVTFRGFTVSAAFSHPIESRFVKHGVTLSRNTIQFLENHVDYVKGITATETLDPVHFYKGDNPGWSAIEQGLDCRRQLVDEILSEHFFDQSKADGMEVVLIKAHAGSGKTVCMRRIAWEAARTYDRLCLFVRPSGVINSAAIQEIIGVCGERVYLFVDKATNRTRELLTLANEIGGHGNRLTVVMAERLNEWNILGEPLSPLVTEDYDLPYLTEKEIDDLIMLLEKHKALGTLATASAKDRRDAFSLRADRQILVALHEVTLGRPFEDIIEDEYRRIQPHEAQKMYLTICVLNRLDIRVRAGLISRSHHIAFEEFQERFFRPLEHIVKTEYDRNVRDHVYFARHPHIAELVFERVLITQELRFEEYIRCINAMNLDYSTDHRAFVQMIRGKTVNDLFPNNELAKAIYKAAKNAAGEDPNLYHQMGVYEMTRANGNLITAQELLFKAQELHPRSGFIKHSIAEHYVRMADAAKTDLEVTKYLNEAAIICQDLKRNASNSYPHHTLVKIGIRRVRSLLESPERPNLYSEFEEVIKTTEGNLLAGLQTFPGDSYLLSAESELAKLLNEETRALAALEKAFASNPRSSVVARRLASCYSMNDKVDKAKQTIETALAANTGDRKLHYMLAKILFGDPTALPANLEHHLRKSFAPGDKNYDAQLLYGRQLFINGQLDDCRQLFKKLSVAPVPLNFRTNLLYPLEKTFTGSINSLGPNHCWIRRDGPSDLIFAHRGATDHEVWQRLTYGERVSFKIGFNFKGPTASSLAIVT